MQFSPTPVTSSLFGPNILLNTLFSNILSLCSSLMSETKFHTHTKPKTKLSEESVQVQGLFGMFITSLFFTVRRVFSGHYLHNHSTLDIGVLGYIGIF
jgi:hypothetical protein